MRPASRWRSRTATTNATIHAAEHDRAGPDRSVGVEPLLEEPLLARRADRGVRPTTSRWRSISRMPAPIPDRLLVGRPEVVDESLDVAGVTREAGRRAVRATARPNTPIVISTLRGGEVTIIAAASRHQRTSTTPTASSPIRPAISRYGMWVWAANDAATTSGISIMSSPSITAQAASSTTSHASSGRYGFHGWVRTESPNPRISTATIARDECDAGPPEPTVTDPDGQPDPHEGDRHGGDLHRPRRTAEQPIGRREQPEARRPGMTSLVRQLADPPGQSDQRGLAGADVLDPELGHREVEHRVPAPLGECDHCDEQRKRHRERGASDHACDRTARPADGAAGRSSASEPTKPVADPPPGDQHHRLDDDPPRHLRLAEGAVAEDDRRSRRSSRRSADRRRTSSVMNAYPSADGRRRDRSPAATSPGMPGSRRCSRVVTRRESSGCTRFPTSRATGGVPANRWCLRR